VDRAQLLEDFVTSCFHDMRWGNKREERQACDSLNEISRLAVQNIKEKK